MNSTPIVSDYPSTARAKVHELQSSKIREIANAAMGRPNVLPFWFGEPDVPTSDEVCAAAIRSLEARETFYVQTLGLPELREQVATYVSNLHSPRSVENVAVTGSGTSSLMLALQSIVDVGDRLVAVVPLWPNLLEMPRVLGAHVTTVSLDFSAAGWQLNLERLIDALIPGTKALLLNSPGNPTGWVLLPEERNALLEHCRKHGIWIISDDVYERIYYEGNVSPTFLDVADPEDRVISCNSFSKAWRMTGWRVGWIVVPKTMGTDIGKLIEFNNGGVPAFVQRGALHAMARGEADVASTVARLKTSRDQLAEGLASMPRVQTPPAAKGAMYTLFKVDGMTDSLAFAKDLIDKVGLGLAPGSAFGAEGEGYLRWCFASSKQRIDDGLDRFRRYLMT
ncbi:pyridoxal phosphate-dependent aminotransferase [Paraburkholderia sp. HD33-4]|uniref:pyridoxal phosphate-dependent aminotransferase n=1 Tax=Paraburkholderia sp. HD33-4 TaxID=2883242 RepID=UPI001F44FF9A|nr:pyridoxal phosphate-dependent aminotransferase [Paraburkholderia sp. HD33-4]